MPGEAYTFERRNYPEPHSVVGVDVTILVSGEVTGGPEITVQTGNIGSGPPPHSHPWDESFFVVKGAVEFTVSDKRTKATSGTFFHLPAGTIHGFCIQENDSVMLEITGVGSQSTAMFRAIAQEVAPGKPTAEDVNKLLGILARFGANVHA